MSSGPPAASGIEGRAVAIEVRDLRKTFRVPVEHHTTLKERAAHPRGWLRPEVRELRALRGVSFDVARGEFFGVIGRNGSGKSTLLKLLSSIYRRDGGSIRVAGRLAPFIELGVGFNPELTARDNVVLNGVMMGLSPREARSRFEAVIDYAELWDFTELKLKNYSSGMHVRLAFSLMLQVDADILLVDEVLAVGDAAFRAKCTDSLQKMKRDGVTVVLVTHDMNSIREQCDRAMLVEDGVIDRIGPAPDIADRYFELLFALPVPAGEEHAGRPRAGVEAVWISDERGEPAATVERGQAFVLNATIRAHEDLDDLHFWIEVTNSEGVRVAGIPIGHRGELAPMAAGEEVTVRFQISNPMVPGGYRFTYALASREPEFRVWDRCTEPVRLRVEGENATGGVVDLHHELIVERGEGRE